MLRIAKFLRPYWLFFGLSVLLLFGQANFELALPDYLSQIINIGIQQSGIASPQSAVLRASQMERLAHFLTADEQARILADYDLVQPDDPAARALLGDYPGLADQAAYLLRPGAAEPQPALSRALWAAASLEQAAAEPGQNPLQIDLTGLPAGADLWARLEAAQPAQRAALVADLLAQLDAQGEEALTQGAIQALKAEYAALGMDLGARQTAFIFRIGGLMLLFTLLSGVCAVAVGYFAARAAAGVGRDVRAALFRKVESFSNVEFDKFPTASLITRTTNDVSQLQMVTQIVVRMGVYAPILGIGGILRAVGKGSSMWWTIALALLVLTGVIAVAFSLSMPKFRLMQKMVDRLNQVSRETLSGMLVTRAFNRQSFEKERFDTANQDLTANTLFTSRVMVIIFPIMMLVLNLLTVVIVWVGAEQVAQASMQVGDIMAFLQYATQIVMSFLMLSLLFVILPRASISADRIADVLETEPRIVDPPQPQSFGAPFRGEVEFRNVSFRYPGAEEDVLHDISFSARPGQMTAFIGSTGSGKSTIVNLIPRFYDVSEGAVLVDGIDIRQLSQAELRDKIGYVPQRATLFSGTIESNLTYGDRAASPAALGEALRIAQASSFVAERENGLQAEVAQAGANVSGGEKQRLSIARALVKKAPIYIFDDTFSALDYRTDAALRRDLRQAYRGHTVLVVTQRVSTVRNADQIVVLDQGRVVGKGTHAELMKTSEIYREIALSQLSAEELA